MSSSSVQIPASQVPFTQSEKDVWYVIHDNLQSFCSGTNGIHYQYFCKMFVHSFSNTWFGAQFDSAIRAVLPSKRFRLKTKISISAGDASDHKSFFTQPENQLDWSLKSPMCVAFSTCIPFLLWYNVFTHSFRVIPHGKDLQISLKSFEKSIKMTLSYDNIIKHILDINDGMFNSSHFRWIHFSHSLSVEYNFKGDQGQITVIFESNHVCIFFWHTISMPNRFMTRPLSCPGSAKASFLV